MGRDPTSKASARARHPAPGRPRAVPARRAPPPMGIRVPRLEERPPLPGFRWHSWAPRPGHFDCLRDDAPAIRPREESAMNVEDDSPDHAPDAPPGDAAGAMSPAPEWPGGTPRVLVVDDEAPVANFLAEALQAMGIETTIACDGEAALESFAERRPDLVICDLLLPKRNGFQLIEEFRRTSPEVPVVAMSGIYRRERYAEELAHAQLFLAKPIDLVHVQEAVSLLKRSGVRAGDPDATPVPLPRARRREPWIPLSVLPLPRLLHLLWSDRRTGIVTLRSEHRQIVMMLQDGMLRFVRTNDEELRLDRVLLQLGRVTPKDLAAAQDDLAARTAPARLGEVLVERGAVSRAELDRAIQIQLRRIVSAAFAETQGETLFRAESEPPGEDVVIESDLRSVIVAGCLSVRDDGDRLLGHLPDGACRVELAEGAADENVKLPAAVMRLLEALDPPTRLCDFVAMADLVGIRGRWLAFGLLCSDVLRVSEAGEWRGIIVHGGASRPAGLAPLRALLELEHAKASGILRAKWEGGSAWLALEEGRLVQGASADARTRIGGLLRSAGLVTPEQLEAALSEQRSRPGRPLGHVLVEMGLLSPSALRTAVPAQVRWVAREMLAPPRWDASSFTEGERADRENVEVGSSLSDVVMDALREMPDDALYSLVEGLAPPRRHLDLSPLQGRVTLTESEELVVSALSEDTASVMAGLERAERRDPDLLRVLAMSLLWTTPHHDDTDPGLARAVDASDADADADVTQEDAIPLGGAK